MTLRDQMQAAVADNDMDAVDALASEKPRSIRYLVGLMYRTDETVRKIGARGIARASRHHPVIVKKIIERIVWAMDRESNMYAPTAPEVLLAIAEEEPELLLPVATDLIRLSVDTSLNQGLCDTLRRIAERCPGGVGQELTKSLNSDMKQGGRRGKRGNR